MTSSVSTTFSDIIAHSQRDEATSATAAGLSATAAMERTSRSAGLRRQGHEKLDGQDEDTGSEDNFEVDKPQLRRAGTTSRSFTVEEETAVIKKLDRRLVLFLGFLYMLSFLDRSNIGNARIAGLEDSLSLTSSQFDWLLTTFYITYITFEWMIMLYRTVPAHIYIAACVLAWGLVACLQALVASFPQLLLLRALLGISEAAFGPGIPFFMTYFYKRSELAYRVGLQISAAPLATSFASSLAWAIVKLSEYSPLEPWRALFLVEGFPSIVTAVFAFYLIPDSPQSAPWLNARERRIATLRLQPDSSAPNTNAHDGSNSILSDILTTLRKPHAWLTALMFLSVNVSFASLPVFLPTIINAMVSDTLQSQALSAPPYLAAFIFVLLIGHYSDKVPNSRSLFLIGVALLSALSYLAIAIAGAMESDLGEAGSITIRYLCVYGAAMGLFSSVTLIITWTLNNQQSATGKGMAMTMLNVVGQCGPLIGVRLFPQSDGPAYVKGMSVCAGFMAAVAGLALAMRIHLHRLNRKEVARGEYEMVPLGNQQDDGDMDAEDEEPDHDASIGTTGNVVENRNIQSGKIRQNWKYML